jgi:hypothetical protein
LAIRVVSVRRTYDLRLPRVAQQGPGLVFTDSPRNWVAKRGSLNELMVAMRVQNSPVGVHASNNGEKSLCAVPLNGAETISHGSPEVVAGRVTCRFCQARLVNAGVLDPNAPHVQDYARDYGTR